MMTEALVWLQLHWPRPVDEAQLLGLLRRLAAEQRRQPLIFEITASAAKVSYRLGSYPANLKRLQGLIRELVPGTELSDVTIPRAAVARGARLLVRRTAAGLDTAAPIATTRALLEALAAAKRPGEGAVLQVMLGPGTMPRVAGRIDDSGSSWLDLLLRGSRPALPSIQAGIRAKQGRFGFQTIVRVGAYAQTEAARKSLMLGMQSALGTLRAPGSELRLVRDFDGALDEARLPRPWPTRLAVEEVVRLLAAPIGKEILPGLPSPHPKLLGPGSSYRQPGDVFATGNAPGPAVQLGGDIGDRLHHSVVLGGTGSGKSNVLRHLIDRDLTAGRSIVVLDPKADLVRDVLTQIPAHRLDEVVVIDPTDVNPVGLNPLITPGSSPELTADGILSIFKSLWPSAFGGRTTDVMHASLLTLAHHGQASLVWLPRLLTDPAFRSRLTRAIDDPVGLGPFWAQFEALSPAQQAQAIAPSLSRLRQLLLRPSLRSVLGQVEPKFQLQDVFTKPRIVLVALNRGILGPEAAKLLGSLVVSQLWQLTLARAAVSQDKRTPVSVYVDEMQDYLHLPTDLADALSQSRSLGVAWHLAHQYRQQAPQEVLAAIDANARNKIIFGLDATDAAAMAKHAPELEPIDFQSLGRYEIYTRLMNDGHQTGWMSGRTLPPPRRISDEVDVRARSQARYGQAPTLADLGIDDSTASESKDEPIGRKARQS